jgi:hypothetical protein
MRVGKFSLQVLNALEIMERGLSRMRPTMCLYGPPAVNHLRSKIASTVDAKYCGETCSKLEFFCNGETAKKKKTHFVLDFSTWKVMGSIPNEIIGSFD